MAIDLSEFGEVERKSNPYPYLDFSNTIKTVQYQPQLSGNLD